MAIDRTLLLLKNAIVLNTNVQSEVTFQMKGKDTNFDKLLHHVRRAVDVLEQILLRNPPSGGNGREQEVQKERRTTNTTASSQLAKLAYTLNEVRELVGISRSAIYLALDARDLRAVKCGRRTLILAKDLQLGWKDCRKNPS